MLDRRPERLDSLAGERPPGEVDDRDRDPERQLGGGFLCRDEGRLRVQRVEDRLDQEQVDASLTEAANLLGVSSDDIVEGDRPVGRIVDLRGERERDVQRPDRPGDEPAAGLVGGLPREPRSLDVHIVDGALEPVVRLADRGRGERVRRRDVRAGCQVPPVDVEHEVGARQVEQVRIAGDVLGMIGEAFTPVLLRVEPRVLDHRAPGAVEHEDPLVQKCCKAVCALFTSSRGLPKEDGSRRLASSLGVFYPGRQAAFKAFQVLEG